MSFNSAIASIILATTALLAAPELFASNSYKVSASIEQNGNTVGEPVVLVSPGAPASVAMHGEEGYAMTVTVTPQEDRLLQVTVKAETFQGSVSTVVTTRVDNPIIVASGDLSLTLTIAEDGA